MDISVTDYHFVPFLFEVSCRRFDQSLEILAAGEPLFVTFRCPQSERLYIEKLELELVVELVVLNMKPLVGLQDDFLVGVRAEGRANHLSVVRQRRDCLLGQLRECSLGKQMERQGLSLDVRDSDLAATSLHFG